VKVRKLLIKSKSGEKVLDTSCVGGRITLEADFGRPSSRGELEKMARRRQDDVLNQHRATHSDSHSSLFALVAGTGMRRGELAGLHVEDLDLDNCVIYVRRNVWNGRELAPKTRNALREIDIDPGLADLLRQHIGGKKTGRVFEARNANRLSECASPCAASTAQEA
jgi:integrase